MRRTVVDTISWVGIGIWVGIAIGTGIGVFAIYYMFYLSAFNCPAYLKYAEIDTKTSSPLGLARHYGNTAVMIVFVWTIFFGVVSTLNNQDNMSRSKLRMPIFSSIVPHIFLRCFVLFVVYLGGLMGEWQVGHANVSGPLPFDECSFLTQYKRTEPDVSDLDSVLSTPNGQSVLKFHMVGASREFLGMWLILLIVMWEFCMLSYKLYKARVTTYHEWSLRYPHSTIWYIEASRADGSETNCGSGTAIWLQKIEPPEVNRRYLLTCAHVVRGNVSGSSAKDKEAGYGPLLPNIEVWAPNTGFGPPSMIKAKIATEIRSVEPNVVPLEKRGNAADDWLVLQLENDQASQAMDTVRNWDQGAAGTVVVLGYPGGVKSFRRNKVIPRKSQLSFCDLHHGVVRLNGVEARRGMSGGGVFDSQNRLIGIHRARQDDNMQCYAVSIKTILEQLRLAGYQLVDNFSL